MGQTLSEPVTNKETAICQDENYKVRHFPSRSDDSLRGSENEIWISKIIALLKTLEG